MTRLLALLLLPGLLVAQERRALTHADYDIWNSVSGMTVAPNGRFVAYTLAPVKGDSTLIVRNLITGAEFKFSKGGAAPVVTPTPTTDEDDQAATPPPVPRSVSGGPSFTPDSKFLYFVLTPTKAEIEKATAAKKKPEELPRPVVAVLNLAEGKIVERIGGLRSFAVTGIGAGLLVTQKETAAEAKPEAAPMPKTDQAAKAPETAPAPRPASGSELTLRDLASGKQAVFTDVQDYSITKDFAQIAYTTSGKKGAVNGVFFADVLDASKPLALAKGPGRFYRMTWDEPQQRLAFFHDESPAPESSPVAPTPPTIPSKRRGPTGPELPPVSMAKPRVYLWHRPANGKPFAAAEMILGPDTAGLKKGWQIVDRGGLSFSFDGLKLNLSAAAIPEKPAEAKKGLTTDKVELDLWHWKDEAIQPMQKVRAGISRNRSFPAVYLLDEKRFVHLADEDRSLRAPDIGDWAVGVSDKNYRLQTWESPSPADYSLVNIRSGEAKPILTAARSGLSVSPKGDYATGFDGQQWFSIAIPDGKKTMLTAKLTTKFANDEFDMPMTASPYPQAGWGSDGKHFFVHDKHDIWKLAPDGGGAVNLTNSSGGLRFRLARVEKSEDDTAPERGLDPQSPWLLAAENLATHDTGLYRMLPGQPPKLLVMGPRGYGVPFKAKKANTFVFTISTFTDYPDYYSTSSDFKEVSRITDANPHRKNFNWARAEILNSTSTDGVKLQSILVKPENFDPAKKYPMVVYIYERLTSGFHTYKPPVVSRGQVINPVWYASNGYLVLMPDIAYKIGEPGLSAMHCVLPAIQAAVERGSVDENAIGINGQSWGGYQIAYMVTQTSRFKAAVAGAAVSNMVSAYNGIRWGSGLPRQFQYEHTQSRIGSTLWQSPLKYIENSPVFMADRVTTPLLLINNDADDAVPWYQGIEFYLSLRRLGREVYMLNYNNEPHNLVKPINARDFALRMHQFFEHHLKGAPMPPWMAKGVPYLERESEKEQWKQLFTPGK